MSELDDLYDGREQTLVKHRVLERYLQRFAYIIGSWSKSITYVDCYSGPWEERSSELADTSFDIAIKQLKAARSQLGKSSHISENVAWNLRIKWKQKINATLESVGRSVGC